MVLPLFLTSSTQQSSSSVKQLFTTLMLKKVIPFNYQIIMFSAADHPAFFSSRKRTRVPPIVRPILRRRCQHQTRFESWVPLVLFSRMLREKGTSRKYLIGTIWKSQTTARGIHSSFHHYSWGRSRSRTLLGLYSMWVNGIQQIFRYYWVLSKYDSLLFILWL